MFYPRRSAPNRPPPRYPRTVRHPRGTRPATGVRRRRSGRIPKVPPSVLTTRAAGRKLIPASRRGPFVPGIPTPKGKAAMPKKATKAQIRSNCENAEKSAAPQLTTKHPAQRNRRDKNYQTDPISPNSSQISILQRGPDPAPSRVSEIPGRGMASGFRTAGLEETRGFSRPSKPSIPPLPPGLPPTPSLSLKAPKSNYQTDQSRRTHLNHQLAGPRSPSTRSVDLGFEIRGFSHPRNHESSVNPPRPPSPPACRQVPTPSQTAKIELPNRPISANHF